MLEKSLRITKYLIKRRIRLSGGRVYADAGQYLWPVQVIIEFGTISMVHPMHIRVVLVYVPVYWPLNMQV